MAQEKKINDQTDGQQQQNQPTTTPQVLAGSTQSGDTSRIASFSSGTTPQAQNSSRFTNVQNYINANQQGSNALGARANQQINRGFNQGENQLENQNKDIQNVFNQGKQNVQTGQGYQTQLQNIGQGFQNGFTDFGNRAGFNQAGQQAQQLAGNQDYNKIASGQGVDQTQLQQSQGLANQQSQDLLSQAKTNLGNIETGQGRNNLFSQVLQPKQGYSSGQRSFDQLFLNGQLGNIKSNLQNNQNTANQLVGNVGQQGQDINGLIQQNTDLTKGINTQAQTNQDTFNKVFGDQKNIDYVNQQRNQRFNDVKNALTGQGPLSQENSDLLGLNNVGSTFINDNQPQTGENQAQVQKNLVGTYNLLNDPNAYNKYISQGANASSIQDIATQPDYDTYKALQNLALGRDTGLINGVSQLGNSINQSGNLSGDITNADKAFRDTYGNQNYQAAAGNYGDELRNQLLGNIPGNAQFGIQQSVNSTNPLNLQDYLNQQSDVTNSNIQKSIDATRIGEGLVGMYPGDMVPVTGQGVYKGATSVAQGNIGDYLKSGNINSLTGNNDLHPEYIGNNNIRNATESQAQNDVTSRINNIINQQGVKNSLTVDPTKNENYKRFGGLV